MHNPDYYTISRSAKPAALSFGQWLVVLLVAVVAAGTALLIVLAAMGAQAPAPMPMPMPLPIDPVPGDGIDRSTPNAVVAQYVSALSASDWDRITELRHPTERTPDGGWADNQGNTPGPNWDDAYASVRIGDYEWESEDGHWAVRVVYYRFLRERRESDDEYSMRLVLKLEQGQWWLRLDHWSDDTPADLDEGLEGAFGR